MAGTMDKQFRKGTSSDAQSSDYLISPIRNGWLWEWEKHGWKNAKGKDVGNWEQWKELMEHLAPHSYRFVMITGSNWKAQKKQRMEDGFMYKFGEFDSYQEMNAAAAGFLNEGDIESLKAMAEENGLDSEDVQDYIDGELTELATCTTAALGRMRVEQQAIMRKGKHLGICLPVSCYLMS